MIGQLRDGDVVVVWKLDRLSRSLKDMLHIMERIELAGAGFRSLTEAIDTTTAAGRMMMQMVGSFAEFERAMIRERTSAGLAQARAEGRIGGRRPKLGDKQRREIAESVTSGRKSGAEMARLYGVSEPTVRSEEHTSELQSLMRISYAVFCLKKKKITKTQNKHMRKTNITTKIETTIRQQTPHSDQCKYSNCK